MANHSPIAPSKAPRFVYCPGSVQLESLYPEVEQSQEAKEGDAAHWAGATILRDMVQFKQARKIPAGSLAANGIVLTDEMLEAAEAYADDVISQCGDTALEALHIEQRESALAIHPDFWGTPDCWWFAGNLQGGYLYIHDFKYGHRYVDPFENWQLIGYAACILSRPEFAGIDRSRIRVTCAIVQPRNYHASGPVRRWEVMADKLAPLFGTLSIACHEATTRGANCKVNDECRDCLARHACTTLQAGADAAMDFAGVAAVMDLTPTALGVELRMIHRAQRMLEARATGLEEQAISTIRSGQSVPFYFLGQGQAREKWTADAASIFAVGDAMGVDLRRPPEPITPNQARKAGVPADLVKGFSDRPPGAIKLEVSDTDTARKVFG